MLKDEAINRMNNANSSKKVDHLKIHKKKSCKKEQYCYHQEGKQKDEKEYGRNRYRYT